MKNVDSLSSSRKAHSLKHLLDVSIQRLKNKTFQNLFKQDSNPLKETTTTTELAIGLHYRKQALRPPGSLGGLCK